MIVFESGDRVRTKRTAFGGVPEHEVYRGVSGTLLERADGVKEWWKFEPDVEVIEDDGKPLPYWLVADHEIEFLPEENN